MRVRAVLQCYRNYVYGLGSYIPHFGLIPLKCPIHALLAYFVPLFIICPLGVSVAYISEHFLIFRVGMGVIIIVLKLNETPIPRVLPLRYHLSLRQVERASRNLRKSIVIRMLQRNKFMLHSCFDDASIPVFMRV